MTELQQYRGIRIAHISLLSLALLVLCKLFRCLTLDIAVCPLFYCYLSDKKANLPSELIAYIRDTIIGYSWNNLGGKARRQRKAGTGGAVRENVARIESYPGDISTE